MSAQPQSPAPEPPSCHCTVVRDGLEPARCRCYVEPVLSAEKPRTWPVLAQVAAVYDLTPEQTHNALIGQGRNATSGATIELSGTFGLTECTGFEEVARGAQLTRELVERTREQVLTSELHTYLAAGAQLAEPTPVQRPSLGRVVHVLVHPSLNGGSDVASAVITRVCSRNDDGSWRVNLRVWLDGTNYSHEWAPGRTLHADEDTARLHTTAHLDQLDHAVVGVYGHCFWPARS